MIHDEPDKCLATYSSALVELSQSSSPSSACAKSNQICSNHYFERSCLTVSVPFKFFLNPSFLPSLYASLQCCFRCCFEYFLALAKVDGDKIDIPKQERDKLNLPLQAPRYRALTFGLSSLLSISSYIVTDQLQLGNIPVMHITTLATLEKTQWTGIKGRRVMLMTHVPHCVPTALVQGISSSMSHFGNPTVATWYTTQLPCELTQSSGFAINPANITIESMNIISGQNDISMPSKLLRKLFSTTAASPTLPWMNLIPMGVRDTQTFDSAVFQSSQSGGITGRNSAVRRSAYRSKSPKTKNSKRSVLLDTTCAREYTESVLSGSSGTDAKVSRQAAESITKILDQLKSNGFSNDISTIGRSKSPNKDLEEYYRSLLTVKFVLSPSLQTALSNCEWEALAAGSIPVLDAKTIAHPSIRALYDGLPILYVHSWSEVTPTYLETQYEIMTGGSTTTMEKAFFPYWLDKLTKHLISGEL